MSITSILGFFALLGVLLFVGGIALAINNASNRRRPTPGVIIAILGLLLAIVFYIGGAGVVQVNANEVAVVYQPFGGDPNEGRLTKEPLGPGVHIIVPGLNVPTIYSTRLDTYTMSGVSTEGKITGDDAIKGRTKDGQQVDLDVSIVYGVSAKNVNLLHLKWQNRFESEFVRPTSREAVREVASAYSVEEIYGEKRAELKTKLIENLTPKFAANGLVLSDVLVRNITFSTEYIKAIEQKQVAAQDAERAKQEAERVRTQAKGQADAAVLAAKGESDALAARAQGEADAIRIKAKAEADALALINEQLQKNPLLIQYTYVQKLAEKVTIMLVPSNSPFLFDTKMFTDASGSGITTPPVVAPTATPTK
jgi:regulator of protease activity HflC (stomatin/prohibitin superfamily)